MKSVIRIELSDTIFAAYAVLAGDYGNGEERRQALKEAGYDPDLVQACVNDLCAIRDKYGGE